MARQSIRLLACLVLFMVTMFCLELNILTAKKDEPPIIEPHEQAYSSPPSPPSKAAAALCKRREFSSKPLDIAIYVFAWRRLDSLQRLVRSLQAAEYCGRATNLSLTFLLDAEARPAVYTYANAVVWPHGRKRVVLEPTRKGIRGMWLEVLSRELEQYESPSAHVLPLEDDTAVSPLFYWWLTRAALQYGPFDHAGGRRTNIMHGGSRLAGVSLYTPRLDEIHYPSRHFRPRWNSMASSDSAFLFELPCSWGALYFRDYWRAFLSFYALRAYPPFYNTSQEDHQKGKGADREVLGDPALGIANSRASTWPRSWKRFMVDFMYGRGDVMLYPSLPRDPRTPYASYSFSTTYMERGAHSGTDAKVEAETDGLRPASEYDYRKTVPLVSWEQVDDTAAAMGRLPPYEKLRVLDLLHVRVASTAALTTLGRVFIAKGRTKTIATPAEYDALAKAWQRDI